MLKLIAEADKHEFDGELTAVISDPVVLGLGQAIVNREGELKKKYDDKVRLITLEKNTSNCQLQEKTEENERMSTTVDQSDMKIAELTDSLEKLEKTLATLQKTSRDLAMRCSKAAPKDVPDLQMHAMCLLTQKAYHETDSARSRSPRRRKR